MKRFLKDNSQGLSISLAAHLLVIGLLFVIPENPRSISTPLVQSVKPIDAVVIDARKMDSELKKLRDLERRKKTTEQRRIKKLQDQARAAKKERKQEEKRLAEVKRKQVKARVLKKKLEKERVAAAKRELKKKKERERQAVTETKRLQQIKLQQVAAERKQKLEEQRLAKLKKERQLAEDKQRKAKEDATRRELERELQAGIAREQKKRNARLIDEYIGAIQSKVQRNWLQYAGNQRGKSCTVRVSLIPGGDVVSVRIIRSSGDNAFDQSVEQAVFRASPLPVPDDPALFNLFRDVSFVFTPSG